MPQPSSTLPAGFVLRRAVASDLWTLRRIVLFAKLDPTQLRWQQFWAIEHAETIVACGQLRQFHEAQELGSLVVVKKWRDRGLGTHLTQHLIQQASQPLYLECLGFRLVQFYSRLGFAPIEWQHLPQSLKPKFALSHLGRTLLKLPITLMHLKGVEINK